MDDALKAVGIQFKVGFYVRGAGSSIDNLYRRYVVVVQGGVGGIFLRFIAVILIEKELHHGFYDRWFGKGTLIQNELIKTSWCHHPHC